MTETLRKQPRRWYYKKLFRSAPLLRSPPKNANAFDKEDFDLPPLDTAAKVKKFDKTTPFL
jgi:hypothetical protein